MKFLWAAAAILLAISLVEAAPAARRNWAYLQLTRGNIVGWQAGTAKVVAGTRADDLVLLRRALRLGDWTSAQRMLTAHSADPDRLAPLIVLVEVERRADAGDFAGAREALSAVNAQSSYDSDVWYRLGQASERAGLTREAVVAYEHGAARDAASPWSEGRYRIAMIYQREAQWLLLADLLAPLLRGATDQDFQRPIQSSQPGGAVWQGSFLALGDAYEHLGQAANAEATYDRLCRIASPRRDWTLNRALVSLARARRTRGDFVPALEAIVRALDLATEFESSYRQRFELDTAAEAQALIDQVRRANHLDGFQSNADDVARRFPESPGASYLRGLTSEARCDGDTARAAYARASRLIRTGAGAFLVGRPIDSSKTPCVRP